MKNFSSKSKKVNVKLFQVLEAIVDEIGKLTETCEIVENDFADLAYNLKEHIGRIYKCITCGVSIISWMDVNHFSAILLDTPLNLSSRSLKFGQSRLAVYLLCRCCRSVVVRNTATPIGFVHRLIGVSAVE